MKIPEQANKELVLAKTYIEAMKASKSRVDFEANWKSFLHCLERVWYKANAFYRTHQSWNGWKGKYCKLRKEDPLLSYLQNARSAEEHTVSEIVHIKPGGIGIKPAKGNDLYIDEMRIIDGKVFIRSPQILKLVSIPSRIRLLPIVNCGITYPVPSRHLGKPINPDNVAEIAKAAIDFYQQFLNEAELFFKTKDTVN